MKINIILFVLSFFCTVSAVNVYSQNTRISLKMSTRNLKELFSEIEKRTDYVILYERGIVNNKRISVDIHDETTEEILDKALPTVGLSYHIEGNQIIVVESKKTLPDTQVVQQTTIQAKGVVCDSKGETLIGVSVVDKKNIANGIATGLDGSFSLNVQQGVTLLISYIGYKSLEIQVPADGNIGRVVLLEDAQLLDDVVVIGYGVQKKVNLTGSVASVSARDMETRVNTNLLTSVQGQVPGVTIISRPGQSPSINFRGRGNLGTSEPLYVIDGALSDASFFGSLDPNSIESISFLKDAASSSIYGSRAAFGVVLVTTKKGSAEGGLKINYDGYIGWKQATYTPKVLGSEWYARLYNEAIYNRDPNATPLYTDDVIQKYRDGSDPNNYPNTNWYDLVLNDDAMTTMHSISFSGGSLVKFHSSLGYSYDDSFVPNEDNTRYNLTTNITSDLNKWVSFRSGIKYIQSKYQREGGGISYTRLGTSAPTFVAQHTDGTYGTIKNGTAALLEEMQQNPLRVLNEGGWSNNKSQNTALDLALDFKPIKNLVLTGQMIYNAYDYKSKSYNASMPRLNKFPNGDPLTGSDIAVKQSSMENRWNESERLTYNGLANYNWTNTIHNVGLLLGTSFEQYKYQNNTSKRMNFPTNSSTDINGGSDAPSDVTNGGGSNENKMLSYFGRVNYNYKERYLLEANFRADASSRFYEDNRWGYFPSFSAGWRVSEEDFMKGVTLIDNLKLRASWGKLGNINNVGDYDYFSAYKVGGNHIFDGKVVTGIQESKPANIGLHWEKVAITDIGIDIDILNGKLSLTADYYHKKTTDILLEYKVAEEVGVSAKPSQNLGSVLNKGLELALTHNNTIGDFSYSIGGNMTLNSNEILELGVSDPIIESPWIKKVGHAIGTFYGYKSDGLLTEDDIKNGNYVVESNGFIPNAGDVKYVDLMDDGKLDAKDRTYLGRDVPNFTYGVNLRVAYKNIELTAFGQGVSGSDVFFNYERAWAFENSAAPREYHLGRWTEENPNPNAAYPRIYEPSNAHANHNNLLSDFWLFNANYFRLKNLSLGYRFSKASISQLGLDGLKVYVTAENLFTVRGDKRMKDFDPESASGRGSLTRGTRTIALGVNVIF